MGSAERLTEETADEKLLLAYRAIQHRQHGLIHDLLPALRKIDALDEAHIDQVRDAMFHTDHPYLMALVGPFNTGKSSIINALMGSETLLKTGVTPTTDSIQILRWGEAAERMESGREVDTVFYPSPLLRKVSLVDTPGLESVFRSHERMTRRFLHRADAVLLVMIATQAMTASSLETMQMFKDYGKKVIIVVNQCDLLNERERAEVKAFIGGQSQSKLGLQPDIWMISAKQGLRAYDGGARDEQTWRASGMDQIESHIHQQLGDAARLRQKLQTPLQIVQNVHSRALQAVKRNQSALSHYQGIGENIEGQLAAQRREQEQTAHELNQELAAQFQVIAARSQMALQDIFRLSRGLRSFFGGLVQFIGLARIFGRMRGTSHVEKAFAAHEVFEPCQEIGRLVDKLGPRLEGQDMQDIDHLVKYGRGEAAKLPPDLQQKIIGDIQAPVSYARQHTQELGGLLAPIEQSIKTLELQRLEERFRNSLLYLASWQLIILVLLVAFARFSPLMEDDILRLLMMIVLPLTAILGLLMLPMRGRMLHAQFANRLDILSRQCQDTVAAAAAKQIDYGIQLRKDTIAPLTRLIEAQTLIYNEQLEKLRASEQAMTSIESDLNALGKRTFLGVPL